MFVIGIGTYFVAFVVKQICLFIAKKSLWKISSLNQLFTVGVDGKQITSREQFIEDIIIRNKLKGESKNSENDYFISDFSDDLMGIIKKNDDPDHIKRLIAKEFKSKQLFMKFNSEKLFIDLKNRLEVLNREKIDERIENEANPLMKISLINMKKSKNYEKNPKFPFELIYKWS